MHTLNLIYFLPTTCILVIELTENAQSTGRACVCTCNGVIDEMIRGTLSTVDGQKNTDLQKQFGRVQFAPPSISLARGRGKEERTWRTFTQGARRQW